MTESLGTGPVKPAISALSASLREKIRGDGDSVSVFRLGFGIISVQWKCI
jgi:hypothetical protein